MSIAAQPPQALCAMQSEAETNDPYIVPELAKIGLQIGEREFSKGVLGLGASGSGKSASLILPIIRTVHRVWLNAPESSRPAALIIDPKKELLPQLGQSVTAIGCEDGSRVRFYDYPWPKVDAGLLLDDALGLYPGWSHERDPFWRASAREILKACVALDVAITAGSEDGGAARLRLYVVWRKISAVVGAGARGTVADRRALQAINAPWTRYLTLCRLLQRTPAPLPSCMDALENLLAEHVPSYDMRPLRNLELLAAETSSSVVASAAALLGPLTDRRVQQVVSFDWLPPTAVDKCMYRAIQSGQLLGYQPPDASEESAVVGRAIKRAYLNAILRGAACDERGRIMRRAFYVADEFQRVLGGEEVAFDTVRSAGGCAVVATQSLAALRHALPESKRDAVGAITTNLSTRVQFATQDPLTIDDWRVVLPAAPGAAHLPHVLTVRPLSVLEPGCCYYLTGGRFGYGRVPLSE
jgi:hypothetical protein